MGLGLIAFGGKVMEIGRLGRSKLLALGRASRGEVRRRELSQAARVAPA